MGIKHARFPAQNSPSTKMKKTPTMNKFLLIKCLCSLLLLSILPHGGHCQASADSVSKTKKTFFHLVQMDGVTEVTITANFDSIIANSRTKDYEPGKFEVRHSKKDKTVLRVKLRARGKSRRMMCEFPPLKLKFNKENLDSNGLEPFNEFKLVTHCMEEKADLNENILREFLIYKLLNQLTPYSFRAGLVKITYINTGHSFKKSTHWGIIIEDAESLAYRNNCHNLAKQVINLDSLERYQEKLNSVFQYMIGNADWSYMMARNMELIQMQDGKIIPVPYDFDYSGLVKAPYARANSALGQKTVLDRVFLGSATSYSELADVLNFFLSQEANLMETISDFKQLDFDTRLDMKDYVSQFFKLIKDEQRVENEMLARVKKG